MKIVMGKFRIFGFLFFLYFGCSSLLFANTLLDQADQLIKANRAAEAFDLLISNIETGAGTPQFDLLLGIAALESGQPTQAVFALERVLAMDPNNTRARLELGRAYFEMGENEAAKEEFTATKSQEVPSGVGEAIEQYLTAIDARLSARDRLFRFYVAGRAGYDSNVNSATDSSTVALPAFGNLVFTLDQTARELDSSFFRLSAGGLFSSRMFERDDLIAFAGADIFHRSTFNEQNFDTSAIDARAGLRYLKDDKNAFVGSLHGQKYLIDGDSSRNQAGVNLQWLHSRSRNTQFSVFGQWVIQRFPGQNVRDVNQYSGGVGIVHIFTAAGDPLVYASVSAGTDDELNDTRSDLGRTFAGIRIGGQYTWKDGINLIGSMNYQYSRYGDDDPLFRERRRDHFLLMRTGVELELVEKWIIQPEIQYIRNDSSLIINDFDRWQVFVNARYDF